jgi:hypothetical protein
MPNAKFIDAATWAALPEVDVSEGENLLGQLPSGTYRPVLSSVASFFIPTTVEAAGSLPDVTVPLDEEITPIDVSADFTGDDITYALAPSSDALVPDLALIGGVIQGVATDAAARNIVIRGTNSGDFADSAFTLTTVAGPVIADLVADNGDVTFDTDGTDGTVYIVFGDTQVLSKQAIIDGTGDVSSSFTVTGSGGQATSVDISSIAGETKWLNVVHVAANTGRSNILRAEVTIDAAATAPVITGVPTISGTETEGETLTASPASVAGSPTPARSWQWERTGTPISGATSITYTLQASDVGETITVVQTETNSEGSDTAESAATGTISAASGGIGTPVRLLATPYTDSSEASTTHTTANVTPTGGRPVVIVVHMQAGANGAATFTTATFGGSSVLPAETSASDGGSRLQSYMFVVENPTTSAQAFSLELDNTPRSLVIEILEIPGALTTATVGNAMTPVHGSTTSSTSLAISGTTGTNGSLVLWAATWRYGAGAITPSGVDGNLTQQDSGETSAFRDVEAMVAWEVVATAGAAAASFTSAVAEHQCGCGIEIKAA